MFRIILLIILLLPPALASARWIEDIVTFEVADAGRVEFSHYRHLDALGKDCVVCHNKLFHVKPEKNPAFSMDEMAEGKACGACHNGDLAFSVADNCDSCHSE